MKKTLTALCCAAVLAACSDSGSSLSQIEVRVKNTEGAAVANSAVKLNGSTVQTDSNGIAVFSVGSDYQGTATVSKDNHMSQQVKVAVVNQGETTSFEAVVIEMELAGNDVDFSNAATTPVVVSGSDNSTVTINDNNAFVDAAGEPYTGLVDVYITPVDVTDDAERYAFPGEYSGEPAAGGEAEMIVSYGMADYTFTDQAGAELALADGVQATIDIPMFEEGTVGGLDAPSAGDQIPMWYYDYDDAVWKENELGQGTVVELASGDLVLRGPVNHFTPWNCDDFPQTGTLITIVQCHEGEAAPSTAWVQATSGGSVGSYATPGGRAEGLAAVGTACVKLESVSCPDSRPTASDYEEKCVTVPEDGTATVTLFPDKN